MKKAIVLGLFCVLFIVSEAQENGAYQMAVLQYKGGGDWYSNPTSIPNLVQYCNKNIGTAFDPEVPYVEVGSTELFNYPMVHLTGHGNVVFSTEDVENLRAYLSGGGFLHISDNYGLDQFIRPEMKKVFPDLEFVELPFDHPIYHQKYDFAKGLPKVHVHDENPPQGFALIYKGRVVCFYDFESDLGDGWEDFEVHKDSEETRTKAFQMGANMIQYVFLNDEY